MVESMVIFIALTVQSLGGIPLWYYEMQRAWYDIKFVSPNVIRKYKLLRLIDKMPGIGVYSTSKRKRIYLSHLEPSFIEISRIDYNPLRKGKEMSFEFRSYGDRLNCSSREFLLKLEKLGLWFSDKIMFDIIYETPWLRLRKELNIRAPKWWENLRKNVKNKMLKHYQEHFREGRIYETEDGHLVRSEAEVIIDNWLYHNNIVHAYEWRLPSEEEVYCDFYLPKYNVYIEYWGVKDYPKYEERKRKKLEIYKILGLTDRLIQLEAEDIKNINNVLKRKLAKYRDLH